MENYTLNTENKNIVDAINELKTEIENLQYENLWYGVQKDLSVADPSFTRIGNTDLHRSLPIQNKMRGCLMSDDGTIVKYLNPDTWENEVRDGSQGQVMVEIPDHYRHVSLDENILTVKISEYPLSGFTYYPKRYVGAYEATVEISTNKLCSVRNEDPDYRGGNNQADWDGTYRSMLGMPRTNKSKTEYRTYARNRGEKWNQLYFAAYREMYWLYIVEYANLNSQLEYNAELTTEGFKQGGLGNGVTYLNSNKWRSFNGYCTFIKCGYSDSLGNNTGEVLYTMPFEYDAADSTTSSSSNTYKGEYDSEATYVLNDYVSSGEDLYKCILEAPAGTDLSNTTYFTQITRTVVRVNRYRGVELPFGHIGKCVDGYNIAIEANGVGESSSKTYITEDPSLFIEGDSGNYSGFMYLGTEPRSYGYLKAVNIDLNGNFGPKTNGASTTTYFCDYYFTSIPASGTEYRSLFLGGAATNGGDAGLASFYSNTSVSRRSTSIGARLSYIK